MDDKDDKHTGETIVTNALQDSSRVHSIHTRRKSLPIDATNNERSKQASPAASTVNAKRRPLEHVEQPGVNRAVLAASLLWTVPSAICSRHCRCVSNQKACAAECHFLGTTCRTSGTPGPNRQTLPHGRCAARPPAHPPTRMNTHGPAHTHSTLFQRWCQRSHTVSVSIVIERRTHSRGQREHGARETSRDAPCTLQITPTNESPDDSAGWSCAHAAARRRWPFAK